MPSVPPVIYQASFVVNTVAYGFHIRQNSYGEQTEANLTIRAIPWSGVYTVVVQGAASTPGASVGSNPVTRSYRALVFTETDYLLLRGQRGQIGYLITPREPGPAPLPSPGYIVVMTDCKRADLQDINSINGPVTLDVGFTMLQ